MTSPVDTFHAEIEAARVFGTALYNYRDDDGTTAGVPHAYAGTLLPALLGYERVRPPLVLVCIFGAGIKHLRKVIEQANDEQADGIVQLSMQSAVGYHCVWYRTDYFAVRIDVFPAGEYGPRTLSFSPSPHHAGPTLMELSGVIFLNVTEFVRATLRRIPQLEEEEERALVWVVGNYAEHIDPSRTEDLDGLVLRHPEIADWWTWIKRRYGMEG